MRTLYLRFPNEDWYEELADCYRTDVEVPAPKANFVRLVINGENWGIYANVQQFNKDFL